MTLLFVQGAAFPLETSSATTVTAAASGGSTSGATSRVTVNIAVPVSASSGSNSGGATVATVGFETTVSATGGSTSGGETSVVVRIEATLSAQGGSNSSASVQTVTAVSVAATSGSSAGGVASYTLLTTVSVSGGSQSGGAGIAASSGVVLISAVGSSSSGALASVSTAPPIVAIVAILGSIAQTGTITGSIVNAVSLAGGVPLATTQQNFSMYQGQYFVLTLTVTENGAPVDLTGCAVTWVMQPGVSFPTPTIIKSTTNGGVVVTDAASGVCQITLNAADTASLPALAYYHATQVIDVAGHPYPVSTGLLTLLQSPSTF